MKLKTYFFITTVLFCLIFVPNNVHSEKMDVHFIDVGQGDSILIKTPLNKVILIDGGPPEAGKKVTNYLKENGIKKLDLIIATHPHKDHIGGLVRVMEQFKVSEIIDIGKIHPTITYAKYMNQIRKNSIPLKIVEKNQEITIDPILNIQILNAHEPRKNNNESSIVLKINYGKIDFLLLSDIEEDQEKEIAETYDIQADFVKIAHHGSKTSSSIDFLKRVNPKVALLTYSKHNKYGHPVNKVIENLMMINANIYSTAALGNIIIYTNGKSHLIFTEKTPIDGLLEQVN